MAAEYFSTCWIRNNRQRRKKMTDTTLHIRNRHDFASGKDTVLGSHDDAVRAMAYSTANSKQGIFQQRQKKKY